MRCVLGGGAGLTTGRRPRHRSRTTPATGHRGANPMPLDTVGAAWTCAASRGGVLSVGARGQVCGGERRPMLTEGSRGVAGDRWSALFGHSGALPAQRRLWGAAVKTEGPPHPVASGAPAGEKRRRRAGIFDSRGIRPEAISRASPPFLEPTVKFRARFEHFSRP